MPSKIYETLASGVPLVVSRGGEGEKLVKQFDIGRTFRPQDGDDLANALLDLAGDPGQRALMSQDCRKLAQRFDRNAATRRTEAVLNAVAEGTSLPPARWFNTN